VDLVAQRRLGDVEARCGVAEVELLGDGEEIPKQARLKINRRRLSNAGDTGLGRQASPAIASVAGTSSVKRSTQ
jgi:hypothetical protein